MHTGAHRLFTSGSNKTFHTNADKTLNTGVDKTLHTGAHLGYCTSGSNKTLHDYTLMLGGTLNSVADRILHNGDDLTGHLTVVLTAHCTLGMTGPHLAPPGSEQTLSSTLQGAEEKPGLFGQRRHLSRR